MANELITPENNERVKAFFLSLDRLSSLMERLFASRKPTLGGEGFYTDEELSKKLKISRRSSRIIVTKGVFPISNWAARSSTGHRISISCCKMAIGKVLGNGVD